MSEARTLIRWVWLGAVALLLIGGCTKKKSTSPTEEPIKPARTVMQQYFPLDYGDNWTWEVTCFRVGRNTSTATPV